MKTAWILTGDGINCEVETAEACERAGFNPTIFHLSELIRSPRTLDACSLLVIPGGFSFGDELGSGRVLALKIKHQLGWDLAHFAEVGGLVLGICNGFQTLVALGLFGENIALAANEEGRFRNEWVRLESGPKSETQSLFLKGIDVLELPIRHGEGRLLFGENRKDKNHTALRYTKNPNGSTDNIAGLSDSTGRIFGLMPHPEAFQRLSQHPGFFRTGGDPLEAGAGLQIFKNAFDSARVIEQEKQI
jgi:phosphoribosylformylglycinamidine synthase subunit PurQ / glutaminase